ncbi:hypothetical protein F442_11720 [Phytophthora nicotianae P10297]|uniref:Uncharacterized protein n=1 Tax=Phytophthora nicotianae P10297 TaxID=1317064 RepID=W2Z0W5_PHYNI|nr:hypothetical protein F442_11720 [Phytophthora nicotianae P10297]
MCDLYQRVYICTHGWKNRKSRSGGTRPRQHIRLTDCPFRFVAQWNVGRYSSPTREYQIRTSAEGLGLPQKNHCGFDGSDVEYEAIRPIMSV